MISRITALIALLALLLSGPAFGAESLGGVPQVVDAVADKPVIDPPSQIPGPPLAPDKNGREAAVEIENQRRFDQLRRELHDRLDKLLEGRDKLVDRWLTGVAIVLTAMGVIAPIVGLIIGFLGFQRFRQIEADGLRNVTAAQKHAEAAQKHGEEAKRFVEEIKEHRAKAEAYKEEMEKVTAQAVSQKPDETARTAASIQENPEASSLDRAIAAAVQLQQQRKLEEAIEKWRSIANIAGEENPQIQARAWFSIGYLRSRGEGADLAAAIDAYTKSIDLNPTVMAYNNRGYTMARHGEPEAALADLDHAIELDRSSAAIYESRGYAMEKLRRIDEARADYQQSLALAQAAGDTNLITMAERNLSRLDDNAEP